MDADKINLFIASKGDNFPSESIPTIRQRLVTLPNERETAISAIDFKSPMVALLLSVFLGWLGIDRFYIGDIGLGAGKLVVNLFGNTINAIITTLTFGVGWFVITPFVCIWWLIDLFLIMGATKKKNLKKFYQLIGEY